MLRPRKSNARDNPKAHVGTGDCVSIPNHVKRPSIQPEAIYNNGISRHSRVRDVGFTVRGNGLPQSLCFVLAITFVWNFPEHILKFWRNKGTSLAQRTINVAMFGRDSTLGAM